MLRFLPPPFLPFPSSPESFRRDLERKAVTSKSLLSPLLRAASFFPLITCHHRLSLKQCVSWVTSEQGLCLPSFFLLPFPPLPPSSPIFSRVGNNFFHCRACGKSNLFTRIAIRWAFFFPFPHSSLSVCLLSSRRAP